MKPATSLALFALLVGAGCGARQSPQEPTEITEFPAVACSTLTDSEVARLVEILPTLRSALQAASWSPTLRKPGENAVAALSNLVEGMNVPGIDDSLRPAGSDWPSVRRMLYKVYAASAASGVWAIGPKLAEQWKQDTTRDGRWTYKSYVEMKGACAAVPKWNVMVLNNHRAELAGLDSLGQ
ncbi:hypothetical protein JXD38_02550 [candidate division WOR-3 bacterium]|nr:hypothetical protein [candidate division WOR-3 bacterium]